MQIDGALIADFRATGAAARTLQAQGFDGILSFEGAHEAFLPLATAAEHTSDQLAVAITSYDPDGTWRRVE